MFNNSGTLEKFNLESVTLFEEGEPTAIPRMIHRNYCLINLVVLYSSMFLLAPPLQ